MIKILHLLRRDLTYIGPYLLILLLMPVLFYFIRIIEIPFSTYIVFLNFLMAAPFYFERMEQMDRFMISLPVPKWKLVLTRYISLITAAIIGTGFVLIFEALTGNAAARQPIIMLASFTFVSTFIAVSLPLFYLFEKIWAVFIWQFLIILAGCAILLVISFSSLLDTPVEMIFTMIDWHPTFVLLLFSFMMLLLSYGISQFIYQRKDH